MVFFITVQFLHGIALTPFYCNTSFCENLNNTTSSGFSLDLLPVLHSGIQQEFTIAILQLGCMPINY